MTHFIIIAAAAALTAVTATTTAHGEPVSARVSYADLDLASTAGRTVLADRISIAAEPVCGVSTETIDLAARNETRICRTRAIAAAMAEMATRTALQFAAR